MKDKIDYYNEITDDYIDKLLRCEKEILNAPNPNRKDNFQHKETSFDVQSFDRVYSFSVFIREHKIFHENFTIGLIYKHSQKYKLRLVRYNGDHGIHKNLLSKEKIEGPHIHKACDQAIKGGIKIDNEAIATQNYSSVEEALACFFEKFNFINYSEFYPNLSQPSLFNKNDEST